MSNGINGMMKVFYTNYMIEQANTTTATTGTISNAYDEDKDTQWISVGSDDTTTETIEVDFTNPQTISRIILNTINWREFNIDYWNGSAWVDFTGVYSNWEYGKFLADSTGAYLKDGDGKWITDGDTAAMSEIDFSNNLLPVLYFAFDSVSVEKVRIRVTKTFTTDAQKHLTEFYIGNEIGSFIEDLTSKPNKYTPSIGFGAKTLTKSNMGSLRYERGQKFKAKFQLKELWEQNDLEIIYEMFDMGEFMFWACGGSPEYSYQATWGMEDIYHCIIIGDLSNVFAHGRDPKLGMNIKFEIREV